MLRCWHRHRLMLSLEIILIWSIRIIKHLMLRWKRSTSRRKKKLRIQKRSQRSLWKISWNRQQAPTRWMTVRARKRIKYLRRQTKTPY